MLDRRSVIRREWGLWWRYMLVTANAWGMYAAFDSLIRYGVPLEPEWFFALVLILMVHVVIVGIAAAVLVRVFVRSRHPFLMAGTSSLAGIVSSIPAGWFVGLGVSVFAAVVWTIVLRARLMDLYSMNAASMCPKCRYDLHGLTVPICPECGTPVDLIQTRAMGEEARR